MAVAEPDETPEQPSFQGMLVDDRDATRMAMSDRSDTNVHRSQATQQGPDSRGRFRDRQRPGAARAGDHDRRLTEHFDERKSLGAVATRARLADVKVAALEPTVTAKSTTPNAPPNGKMVRHHCNHVSANDGSSNMVNPPVVTPDMASKIAEKGSVSEAAPAPLGSNCTATQVIAAADNANDSHIAATEHNRSISPS